MSHWILGLVLFLVLAALVVLACVLRRRGRDAYVYLPPGMAVAQFRYQDLPMRECSFCAGKVNLNRHHVISQLAAPEKRDDPGNIVVLCRSCHQVVGHKNNWKKFNPHVRDICEKYGGPPVDSRQWRIEHGGKEAL